MADLSFSQLEGYWVQAGGDPALAPLMAAIALAESSGDPTATNPTDNNGTQTSWGLWQISNGDHSEPDPNWSDPLVNARLAVAKQHNRSGLGNWGTYTSGAYKKYLQSGVAPTTPPAGGAPGGGGGSSPSGGGVSQASLTANLGGWLGTLVSGLNAVSPALGLGGILGTVGAPVANSATDFAHALSTGMTAVLWLVNPRNWVRILAGVVGILSVTVGTVLIVRSSV